MRKVLRPWRRCSTSSTTIGLLPISISKPGRSRSSTTARSATAAPRSRITRSRNAGVTSCGSGCAITAAAPIRDRTTILNGHSREASMDTIERSPQSETNLLQELPLRLHHNAYVVKDHEANRHWLEDVLGIPLVATWC